MTIYKVTVKATFYVEANSMHQAAEQVNLVAAKVPNADINLKATKLRATDLARRNRDNPTRDSDTV